MNSSVKQESLEVSVPLQNSNSKKERIGRWSAAESYLFESLLERYGKNWRRIHQHMKNRSLGQIRSHAQKYFDKIGPKKVEEYERRAKLLEAYETLEKEKRLHQMNGTPKNTPQTDIVKIEKVEQESPLTRVQEQVQTPIVGEEIMENNQKLESLNKIENPKIEENILYFPFLDYNSSMNGGFLYQLLAQNRQTFFHYQGIEPFIDHPGFNACMQKQA